MGDETKLGSNGGPMTEAGKLRLVTLGGLRLEADRPLGGAATQKRALALLAILAAAGPRGISRERLLLYLWPDSSTERARGALKQSLYALRRDLQAPDLVTGTAELCLKPDAITSDVAEFGEALDRGDLDHAIALYTGPFLDGIYLKEAPEFERWVEQERARLARRHAEALEALATAAARRGDHAAATAWWRRLAAVDPTNSRTALGLMTALAASGDRAGALQYARLHEILLREELDIAPDQSVIALVEQIRRHQETRHTPRPDAQPPSPGSTVETRPAAPSTTVPDARGDAPAATDPPAVVDRTPAPVADARGGAPDASPAPAPPKVSSTGPAGGVDAPTMGPVPQSPPVARAPRIPAAARRAAIGLAAMLVALATVITTLHRSSAAALDRYLVVVAPFEVLDPELALWREGLVDVLSRNLDGAGPLRTVSPTVAVRRSSGRADRESAVELARATGAGIAIYGSLLRAGRDSVRATLTLVDVASGRALGEATRRDLATRIDRVTDSLTVATLRELATRLPIGASREPTFRSQTSLDALKPFLRGEQFYRRTVWDSAAAYYRDAAAHDSSFSLPIRRLGLVLAWQRISVDPTSASFLLRAGALNHGLGARDSLLVAADSLSAAASTTPSALAAWSLTRRLFATLDDAVARYPDDPEVWLAVGEARYHLGAGPAIGVSEREQLEAFDRAIALDSAFGPAYIHPIELALNTRGPDAALRYARAYLALDPSELPHRGVQLVAQLLDPRESRSSAVARTLDTASADVLVAARTTLRRWPDSSEAAVRLSRLLAAGRRSSYPLFADTAFMRRRLAEELAFRGHLRESYRTLGDEAYPLFAELAYLGAVPDVAARVAFARWARANSPLARLALPWWSAHGDASSVEAFARRAAERVRTAPDPDARATAAYDTASALAHLALATGDTDRALARFAALPDTLCPDCYLDRLTRAKLLVARGQDREAVATLSEPLVAFLTPIEASFALERARAASAVGRTDVARAASDFAARAWLHADPEVQRLVRAGPRR